MKHIIFIAGAGQDKTAWDDVANAFSSEFTVHTFAPSDLTPAGTNFSIQVSADELNNYMDASGIRQAVLCGLSLGAMICTQFAIDHPEKALSLVLCGSQVHPNPFLMSLQSGIMKLFPEKLLGLPAGLTKRQLLDMLRESAKVDFRNSLAAIESRHSLSVVRTTNQICLQRSIS